MYTTQTPTAADHMARVAAAGRIMAERRALAAKRAAYAESVLSTLLGEGAVKIGVKICTDAGKYRYAMDIDGDREFLLFSLGTTYGEDAEIWGIKADGSYCESVS